MKIQKLATSGLLAVALAALFTDEAKADSFIPADIVWIIDVSGSMSGEISQIQARIGDFNTAMTNAGISASYGLVEFGGNVAGSPNYHWRTLSDIGTFASIQSALNPMTATHGNPESGSSAGLHALNTLSWTNGSVKNLILVTDEDDDSDGENNYSANTGAGIVGQFSQALTNNNALFNVIRSPGAGNTTNTYDALAAAHGGSAFDIGSFRSNPDPFFTNFINTKVEEIQSAAVPEGGATFALFGLSLAGLGLGRRFFG